MANDDFKRVFVIAAIGLLGLMTFLIIRPIALSIITGLILAYVFFPLYKKIYNFIGEKNTSSLIVVLITILIVFLPIILLAPLIFRQFFDFYIGIQDFNMYSFLKDTFPSLADTDILVEITSSFNSFLSDIASNFFSSVSNLLVKNLPNLLLKGVVVIFVFFFCMRDSETFMNYGKSLSPFSKEMEDKLSNEFSGITYSVIYGFIIVGIIQGVLTGLGLFIAGVPQAILLTLIAIVAAIIPIIGSWLVWVPASFYLLASGNTLAGMFLFIYGAIFVSWIDNIIRPYLVARKVKMSSAIVFIGMIGGFLTLGVLGFIIGPLILAYLLLILDAYRNKDFPSLFEWEKEKSKKPSFIAKFIEKKEE